MADSVRLGDRVETGASSFRAGLREELGPPWRFAIGTVLVTAVVLGFPLPEPLDRPLAFWVLMGLITGAVGALRARDRGRAHQLAALVATWAGWAWVAGFVWVRINLGLRSSPIDGLGWTLPIPFEYLILGGLILYVAYELVVMLRRRVAT